MAHLFKQILAPGVYITRAGPIRITEADIGEFARTGNEMIAAGLAIPVPLEHQLGALPVSRATMLASSVSNNSGWVDRWEVVNGTLWADLDVKWLPGAADDAAIEKRLKDTIRFVSPRIDPEFLDGTGRTWRGITHVALTPVPVFAGQVPFGGEVATMLSLADADVPSWSAGGALALSLADCWYTDEKYAAAVPWDDAGPVALGWQGYTSKTGRQAWRSESGETRYQQTEPGTRQAGQGQDPGAANPYPNLDPKEVKFLRSQGHDEKQIAAIHAGAPPKAQGATPVQPAAPPPPATTSRWGTGSAKDAAQKQAAPPAQPTQAAQPPQGKPVAPVAKPVTAPAPKPPAAAGEEEAIPQRASAMQAQHQAAQQAKVANWDKLRKTEAAENAKAGAKVPGKPAGDTEAFHGAWAKAFAGKAADRGHVDPASQAKAAKVAQQISRSGLTGHPLREKMNEALQQQFPHKVAAAVVPSGKSAAPAAPPVAPNTGKSGTQSAAPAAPKVAPNTGRAQPPQTKQTQQVPQAAQPVKPAKPAPEKPAPAAETPPAPAKPSGWAELTHHLETGQRVAPKVLPHKPAEGDDTGEFHHQWAFAFAGKAHARGHRDPAAAEKAYNTALGITRSGLTGEPLRQKMNAALRENFPITEQAHADKAAGKYGHLQHTVGMEEPKVAPKGGATVGGKFFPEGRGLPAGGTEAQAKANQAAQAAHEPAVQRDKAGVPEPQNEIERKTGVREVPTESLHVDPERFQYKQNTGKGGVVREGSALEGVKKFNPDFAGVILAWHDPKDGKDYVVNGHHRHDLATRSGTPTMGVRYLNAKDDKEARKIGALANISEGRGTSVDAAKLIRDEKFESKDFEQAGVSLKGSVAKDAFTLAQLSPDLFRKVTSGALDPKKALAIGTIPDHDTQNRFAAFVENAEKTKKFNDGIPDKVLQEMAIEARDEAKTVSKTESTLFGDETTGHNLFVERNVLKTHIKAKLASEANLFGAVSTEKKAETLKRGKNVISAEDNRRIADEAAGHREMFEKHANLKGPISDAINEAAEELFNDGRKRKDIEGRLIERVREIIQREHGGQATPAGGSEGVPGGDKPVPEGQGPQGRGPPGGQESVMTSAARKTKAKELSMSVWHSLGTIVCFSTRLPSGETIEERLLGMGGRWDTPAHKWRMPAAKVKAAKALVYDLARSRVFDMSTAHAPVGGITIAGKKFKGGQFITDEHLAKATDEQKAKLEYRKDLFDEPEPVKAEPENKSEKSPEVVLPIGNKESRIESVGDEKSAGAGVTPPGPETPDKGGATMDQGNTSAEAKPESKVADIEPKTSYEVSTAKNGKRYIQLHGSNTSAPGYVGVQNLSSAKGKTIKLGGKTYTVDGVGSEFRAGNGKMAVRVYLTGGEDAGKPAGVSKRIVRNSSAKNVDAYREGNTIKSNGQWMTITGYHRSMDDHGGFEHQLDLRPATDAEHLRAYHATIRAELRALSPGPDDERNRDAHDERVAALLAKSKALDEGTLTVADATRDEAEVAAKDAERTRLAKAREEAERPAREAFERERTKAEDDRRAKAAAEKPAKIEAAKTHMASLAARLKTKMTGSLLRDDLESDPETKPIGKAIRDGLLTEGEVRDYITSLNKRKI